PWVWALEAIPLYEAIGRVKVRAHWQSDVVAGWALGTALGWYAHSRDIPILVQVLPDGLAIGLHCRVQGRWRPQKRPTKRGMKISKPIAAAPRAAMRTAPAARSLAWPISSSCSRVMRSASVSMALLTASALMTSTMAKMIHSH